MDWFQKSINIKSPKRGFIIITDEILKQIPEIKEISIGMLNLFIKHTSASISINENCDPTVRKDLENYFNRIVPENTHDYEHIYEGLDDMPAHIKSTIIGNSVSIPITNGKLNLGTWQGIYLCEHRSIPVSRKIIATLYGAKS